MYNRIGSQTEKHLATFIYTKHTPAFENLMTGIYKYQMEKGEFETQVNN